MFDDLVKLGPILQSSFVLVFLFLVIYVTRELNAARRETINDIKQMHKEGLDQIRAIAQASEHVASALNNLTLHVKDMDGKVDRLTQDIKNIKLGSGTGGAQL